MNVLCTFSVERLCPIILRAFKLYSWNNRRKANFAQETCAWFVPFFVHLMKFAQQLRQTMGLLLFYPTTFRFLKSPSTLQAVGTFLLEKSLYRNKGDGVTYHAGAKPKCGCCGTEIVFKIERVKRGYIKETVKRSCECDQNPRCFICGRCPEHERCQVPSLINAA